ncbi:MAG: hypothetical protein GTN74_05045 [Proteobacteria bacterium]|nr:hypothetical protein [Pseudomonadota bacterium]
MKRIQKIFLKFNSMGESLYEGLEELVDHEDGTITTSKRETLFTCGRCGRTAEPHQARRNCPVCGGRCCDFCHEAQLKLERSIFEREIILEREQLRWLESKIFDNFPAIRLIRQIKGAHTVRRLEQLHRKLLEEDRGNG